MKKMMMLAATVALGACSGGGKNNTTSTTTTTSSNTAAAANQAAPNAAAPAPSPAANSSAQGGDAESAGIERTNAEEATATARNISSERDPDARAATCIVFLGISRDQGGDVGFDDTAMRQAQDQWKSELRQRMSQQEVDQLTGSSVNMLMPAAAAERNAASRWCVENAPEVDPDR